MANTTIWGGKDDSFAISKDEASKLYGEEKDEAFCTRFNDTLTTSEDDLGLNSPILKSRFRALLGAKTEKYREFLNKYLVSPNLHILMGTGCSRYAGAQTINESSGDYDVVLKPFIEETEKSHPALSGKIRSLYGQRPEFVLDALVAHYPACEALGLQLEHLEGVIDRIKRVFLEKCVLPINYSTNTHHANLLKRLASRPGEMHAPNIFTTNYDILIERSAEAIQLAVVNGFTGCHRRVFAPATFGLGFHVTESQRRLAANSLNLFKLHGSISWITSDEEYGNPYGIEEIQLREDQVEYDEALESCVIYPIQTKKKHSLDLPYSELFRQFGSLLHSPNSSLLVMGYSFIDDHVNDLIANALLKPDFHLVVFSFQEEAQLGAEQAFLKRLFQ